jgi:hypothetical protein
MPPNLLGRAEHHREASHSRPLARGEFSGLGAEATSERTFSYSGRVFSMLRRSISMENLAAMVIGAAFPGMLTNNQIMDKYLSKLAAY